MLLSDLVSNGRHSPSRVLESIKRFCFLKKEKKCSDHTTFTQRSCQSRVASTAGRNKQNGPPRRLDVQARHFGRGHLHLGIPRRYIAACLIASSTHSPSTHSERVRFALLSRAFTASLQCTENSSKNKCQLCDIFVSARCVSLAVFRPLYSMPCTSWFSFFLLVFARRPRDRVCQDRQADVDAELFGHHQTDDKQLQASGRPVGWLPAVGRCSGLR